MLYLGYDSVDVEVPALGRSLRFQYITEPPRGDALLQLFSEGRSLPGLVWGSDTWWSPNGRWLLLQWSDDAPGLTRTWRLIDLVDWRWTPIEIIRVEAIDNEAIHALKHGGAPMTLSPTDLPGWVELPTPARVAEIDPAIDRLRPRG